MGLQVYKVHFKIEGQKAKHQALYVSKKKPLEGEGWLHHVIEKNLSGRDVYLSYDKREFEPKCAESFVDGDTVLVGTISEDAVKSFDRVCKNVGDVHRLYDSKDPMGKPNCVSWVNNAIYDLNQASILSMNASYKVPSRKEVLKTTSVSAGSSSRSK